MNPFLLTQAPNWRQWVTPRPVRTAPVHRWYLFPHSFTGDLVHALSDEWRLTSDDCLLDPFVGAGTTLVAARDRQLPATGYDLSPLAVFVARVKTASFCCHGMKEQWEALKELLQTSCDTYLDHRYPQLVVDALPDGRLEQFHRISQTIDKLGSSTPNRDFFRLALIALIPRFSFAVGNGGWLRWTNNGMGAEEIDSAFRERVEMMISDLPNDRKEQDSRWTADAGDARSLPATSESHSAVITSPPYPNRHDYTRVFGVELMFAFMNDDETKALRYQSFHSHPEARPKRPDAEEYATPSDLDEKITVVRDRRLQRMLNGYFLDMYLCLKEIKRICTEGGRIAIVVGNAQYDGESIPVDEYTAEIGESVGLACQEIRTVRERGNSAQQMGRFGRQASRESVVMFRRKRNSG